jgi:outer membrane protein OmpA-like peptidoglycan-associated protein
MAKNRFIDSFFSIIVQSFMLSAFLVVWFVVPAFCSKGKEAQEAQFNIINVKSVVRLDSEKEKEYKDYFVNLGTENGAGIGRTLKVRREVTKRSEVRDVADKVVNIPIGVLKIISVEKDSSVARLVSLDKRAENPLVVYDAAMIGDIVTLIKEVKKEVIVLPDAILFDFDKYTLKKDAKDILNKLAIKIAKGNYKKIKIATHTDSIGSSEYNLRLSNKRAAGILKYLTKGLGLSEKLFKSSGYGESKPIKSNKTVWGRQQNRRGEITLYK